jgi:hypothetical protein
MMMMMMMMHPRLPTRGPTDPSRGWLRRLLPTKGHTDLQAGTR